MQLRLINLPMCHRQYPFQFSVTLNCSSQFRQIATRPVTSWSLIAIGRLSLDLSLTISEPPSSLSLSLESVSTRYRTTSFPRANILFSSYRWTIGLFSTIFSNRSRKPFCPRQQARLWVPVISSVLASQSPNRLLFVALGPFLGLPT